MSAITPAGRERAQVRVPLLIVSGAGWLLLVSMPGAAHDHHAPAGLTRLAFGWFVMLTAMMAPLLTEPVRHIRDRSLARQRARSIALFVAGYAVVWMAGGAFLQAIAMRALAVESTMTMLVFASVVAVWQCSPLKQQCLNRGHVHPELAPGGRLASAGAVRFGLTHGIWCVGSCWALMLLPLLVTRLHAAAMLLVFLWIAAERLERPAALAWRFRAPRKAVRLVHTRLAFTMPSRSAIRWASRKPERNAPDSPGRTYSNLSARSGSTCAARRAGTAARKIAAAPSIISGSRAETP